MKTVYYPHSLRDSVHGNIRLTDEEFAIINHSLFFRLHHIRQNSLLYFIFPCASHTRFEHSLGVVHIVDMIYESLLRNSQRAVEKDAISTKENSLKNVGKAVPFHELDQKIIDDLLRIARIAALVHDVGHGPFSHTFDKFAPLCKQIAKIIREDPKLNQIIQLADLLDGSSKLKVEHEQMSCVLFAIIWDEILGSVTKKDGNYFEHDKLPLIVAAVILGQPSLCPNADLILNQIDDDVFLMYGKQLNAMTLPESANKSSTIA
ncbi:HD domain-containing protein [Spirosoma utsteinense]|uniref:HD superfamily phosphohydrolase n=1 Tax=Spirosoma utsteinense TaxID=2585773 RepID=A0ABR6W6P4_9BACT|nr:HD domain-containing protein [Spirosoma utsteinense]MBC3786072.1 HD superfamily phosphohydrolase [Spirosoma utsteinense]MBC3792261.1 HD superfamily phosphohydrolase [Spirosoma utsteinense]